MTRSLHGQKVVIATHNKGKLEEFTELLKPHGVIAQSAGALGLPEPAETEDNFRGNAKIKAEALTELSDHKRPFLALHIPSDILSLHTGVSARLEYEGVLHSRSLKSGKSPQPVASLTADEKRRYLAKSVLD